MNDNIDLISEVEKIPLRDHVARVMRQYFSNLKDESPRDLHEFFCEAIDFPLLLVVMKYAKQNQSKAARILGIARITLRSKLKKFGMLDDSKR